MDLEHRGAKTELILICFLVSCDSSNSIFENAKNVSGKTPMDLFKADTEWACFADLVKSYKYSNFNRNRLE